ncbi:MAG: ExbD/TolR family protein [Prochloraceae cyanobacterium]
MSKKISATISATRRSMKFWQQDRGDRSEVRIEIIPLIDVIFCILTFFILAAVGISRQQAITMDLPQASTGTTQMREMLVVSLDDLGQYYLERELVSKNRLYQELKRYHHAHPEGLMVLYASKNVTYSKVIAVLDMLREVGGDRVALATLPGDSPQPANFYPSSSPYENISPEYLYDPYNRRILRYPLPNQPKIEPEE